MGGQEVLTLCLLPFHPHIHAYAHPILWCLPPQASRQVNGEDDVSNWVLKLCPTEPLRNGEGESMAFSPQYFADQAV